MNNLIGLTINNTDQVENIDTFYAFLFESIRTTGSESDFEKGLMVSSSLGRNYESEKQLLKEKRLSTNELIPFIQNEVFEFETDTKADVLVRRYSESDFEKGLMVSSSLDRTYEGEKQLLKEKMLSANELIPFIQNEVFEYETDPQTNVLRHYSKSDFEEELTPFPLLDKDYKGQEQPSQEEKRFTNELISFILNEEFEYGIDTEADVLVRRHMELNPFLTKKWINAIFVENSTDVSVLIGLLRIIARLDYREILPEGQTIAVAALFHENTEVKECGVRAFEGWGTIESLKILQNLTVGIPWLQEYIDDVVSDLRKEHNVLTH